MMPVQMLPHARPLQDFDEEGYEEISFGYESSTDDEEDGTEEGFGSANQPTRPAHGSRSSTSRSDPAEAVSLSFDFLSDSDVESHRLCITSRWTRRRTRN